MSSTNQYLPADLRGVQVVLDLETLSLKPHAAIIAIGAVKCTVDEGELSTFYENIYANDQYGAAFDSDTMDWWKRQDAVLLERMEEHRISLRGALEHFLHWYGDDPLLPLWGNGAGFDNVILRNAYHRCEPLQVPWNYKADRCLRTLRGLFGDNLHAVNPNEHFALADARFEATQLREYLRRLEQGIGRGY